jgi:hypothetical protein
MEVYGDHVNMQPLETRAILLQVVFQRMETMSAASRDQSHPPTGSYLIMEVYGDHVNMQPLETRAILLQVVI